MFEENKQLIDAAIAERTKFRRVLKRCLASRDGEAALTYLEERFEVNLPAFQGERGHYDPLDAMRRDAYREVFLFVRRELMLAPTNEDEQETD